MYTYLVNTKYWLAVVFALFLCALYALAPPQPALGGFGV